MKILKNLIVQLKKKEKYLTNENIFIFGIKPNKLSDQFGYFTTKKDKNNLIKVSKFIEKPNIKKAKKIIKKGGYWNSGMFFARKASILNNFRRYQNSTYKNSLLAINKGQNKKNIFYLNKKAFEKNKSSSFDYAILERARNINAIKLDISWSDLGSWKEILLMYYKNKKKYFNKKNIFYRPWGKYINYFNGNQFLIKELFVKSKGVLSLQKHLHRSEHWVVINGNPKITLNQQKFICNPNETIFIPQGAIHRIENPHKKPVQIMEAQLGKVLKESDIIRYQDIYGRVN